jgi:hypothetical protein
MRRVIGQAAGRAGRVLHVLSRLALAGIVAVAVAVGALVWRLDQGPLVVPWLANAIAEAASRQIAPMRLEIGQASLVWEGFRGGVDRPLDITAVDVAVFDADGRRIAQVPEVDISLSMRALATGRIAPRGLLVQGARLRAVRREDGTLAVDFTGAREGDGPAEAERPADFSWIFEALAHPPGIDLGGRSTLLSQLRRLQLRDVVLRVDDHALGLSWRAPGLELDVTRFASGGVEGSAALALLVDGRRLSATAKLTLPSVALRADGGGAEAPTLRAEMTMEPLVPAEFATLGPGFAPLAAVEAPVALTAAAELGADLLPRQGRVRAHLAAGTLRIGAGRLPVQEGVAEIAGSAEGVTLVLQRLTLPVSEGRPPTVLTGTALVRPQAGMLAGELDLRLDRVGFADLGILWPDGLADGAKAWITENITAGTAHDLRLRLQVEAAPDLSDGTLTGIEGSVDGRDLVVHWLRPVPPTERVAARLTFVSPDEIDIAVLSGVQGAMTVSGGRVHLTGLAQVEQFATITVDLAGPVPELLGVLNHPRINLLSRRPVPMRDPAGRVEGRLVVTALPLDSNLKLEDVRISSNGRLSGLRLGGIAAGRDLAGGALTFEAGNDGLAARGTATLAGIASQLAVEMDFTDGPPSQVIQKVSVSASASASQLIALGLGLETTELVLDGSAAVKLDLVERRRGRSELSVRADLARLGIRADRLNWGKAAGRRAVAEGVVLLEGDRVAGIERLRVEGEGVSVQGAYEAPSGAPRRLRLTRAVLGNGTDAQGEIQWPRRAGDPWMVRFSGASLDVSGEMARSDPVKPGEEVRGPPWNAELRVDRLVLGPGRIMTGVLARSDNDGRITRNARVTGRAGIGAFELSILPSGQPRRRSLTVTAQDAGGLLAALDVTDKMRGGRLTLNGSYDDSRTDHPLSGTAEVADFAVRDAPAVARLLQAITVVGAFDAFSGPDLRFTRLVAPFRYSGEVIDLAEARAFSASLGMTAKGRIDLTRRLFDVQGTVVPAYFINSLLGRVPLLGKLVSPETGGGLFAMSYGVKGGFDDPAVWVNPLSAVAPGFLRGLFGIFEGTPGGGGDAPAPPPAARDLGQQ